MYRSVLLGITLAMGLAGPVAAQEATPTGGQGDELTVVASGLTNPRGFLWTADGSL